MLYHCQIEKVSDSHGINFLKSREEMLVIGDTNKNDVVKYLGKPHAVSLTNEDKWFYFERVYTRGDLIKLGQNVLLENNILNLTFNNYGVLSQKKFMDKSKMQKIKYSKLKTKNTVTDPSFVNKFLQSVKQKMYGKKKF